MESFDPFSRGPSVGGEVVGLAVRPRNQGQYQGLSCSSAGHWAWPHRVSCQAENQARKPHRQASSGQSSSIISRKEGGEKALRSHATLKPPYSYHMTGVSRGQAGASAHPGREDTSPKSHLGEIAETRTWRAPPNGTCTAAEAAPQPQPGESPAQACPPYKVAAGPPASPQQHSSPGRCPQTWPP